MSDNFVLKVIHTLSFIISQKGEKMTELKGEVKELLLTLNQLIISAVIVS